MEWIKFSEQKPTKKVPCFVGTNIGCLLLQWVGEEFAGIDGQILDVGDLNYWKYAVEDLPTTDDEKAPKDGLTPWMTYKNPYN